MLNSTKKKTLQKQPMSLKESFIHEILHQRIILELSLFASHIINLLIDPHSTFFVFKQCLSLCYLATNSQHYNILVENKDGLTFRVGLKTEVC